MKMFGMIKKGGAEKKSTAQTPPIPENKLKYEKTLYDLKSRRDQIQDNLDGIDVKVETIDKEIRSLISQGKKQWAKIKLLEMKGLQKQIEGMQTKYNVLTTMIIQIETLEQDQGIAEAVYQAVDLAKDSEKTNEKLTDAMMDWNEFQTSSQETSQLWEQMASIGVNKEEIDEEFQKYEQENEQQQALQMQIQLNDVPANKVPIQYQQQQPEVAMEKQLSYLLE